MVRCEECEAEEEDPACAGWTPVKVRVGDWVHDLAKTDEEARALQAARESVGWLCGNCAILMTVDGKDESA